MSIRWKATFIRIWMCAYAPYFLFSALVIFGAGPTVSDRWQAFWYVNSGIFFLITTAILFVAAYSISEKSYDWIVDFLRGKLFMPKGYMISAHRSEADPVKRAAYLELAKPAIIAAGGRFLSTGEKVVAKENGIAQRTVLIEFESFEAAVAAYESGDYRKALDALSDGADRDVRLIEGI